MNIQYIIRPSHDTEAVISNVAAVLKNGCRWIRLAASELPNEMLEPLCKEIKQRCGEYGAVFIIDDNTDLQTAVKADGVHITTGKEDIEGIRKALGEEPLVGANLTDLESFKHAKAFGIDYADIGPYEAYTPEEIRALINSLYDADITLPVSVFGKVGKQDLPTLSGLGVRGVTTSDATFFEKDLLSILDKLS